MGEGAGATRSPFLLLPTIRHSGTNFAFHVLGLPWFKVWKWRGEPGVIHHHFCDSLMDRMEALLPAPVVIPLRRPEAMAKSHMARYGHLDFLTRGMARLRVFEGKCAPYWLPIDAPDRDDYLAKLSEGLGMDLKTEWPVIDSRSPEYSGSVPDIGHEDFFSRFYV